MDEPKAGWDEALGHAAENPETPATSVNIILEADDTQWQVSEIENGIKALFERWMKQRIRAEIAKLEATGDFDAAMEERSAFHAACAAGQYVWRTGKAWPTVVKSYDGSKQLLLLLMRRCHPKVTEEDVDRLMRSEPKQCGEALGWALGNELTPAATGASSKPASQPKVKRPEPVTMESP